MVINYNHLKVIEFPLKTIFNLRYKTLWVFFLNPEDIYLQVMLSKELSNLNI